MQEKFLRLPAVQALVPYSRSTIYRLVASGEFPAPIRLGSRAVAWRSGSIESWISARIAKGGGDLAI
jgi:prophage regulatory protein